MHFTTDPHGNKKLVLDEDVLRNAEAYRNRAPVSDDLRYEMIASSFRMEARAMRAEKKGLGPALDRAAADRAKNA